VELAPAFAPWVQGREKQGGAPRNPIAPCGESGRGLPQSKTLSRLSGPPQFRQVLDCASPLALWHCFADASRSIHYTPPVDLGLKDKVALVTGGASGIGAAVTRLLASEGARVVIADRDEAGGSSLARELHAQHRTCHFVHSDLTLEADCERCVHETLDRFGGLDLLINNAGGNDTVGLEQSPAEFNQSLQRNLFHVFAITHYAVEALKKSRGAIVNVSSKVSVTGQGHTSGYAAAKGGVNALTREWAVALAVHGIRVNAIAPAECDTPKYRRWFEAQVDPAKARASIEKLVPLGRRMTTAEEIAATIVFVGSPCSSHTTGQIIFVDGGYTHLDRALVENFGAGQQFPPNQR
jgi:L-fucose dehydrogenase